MNITDFDSFANKAHEIVQKNIEEMQRQEDEIFEAAIRNNVNPPIKGNITKGKIRWRGIVLIHKNDGFGGSERWLEQRGIQISPKIVYKSQI